MTIRVDRRLGVVASSRRPSSRQPGRTLPGYPKGVKPIAVRVSRRGKNVFVLWANPTIGGMTYALQGYWRKSDWRNVARCARNVLILQREERAA